MKPVTVVSICDVIPSHIPWEQSLEILKAYCKKHKAHYYARPRESFYIYKAIEEARKLNLSIVVVEDLS